MKKLIFAALAGVALIFAITAVPADPSTGSGQLDWQTDLPKALAQAKAEKKLVLLNFTGSDWCAGCKVLDLEVFNQPEFAAFAKTNLVLVEVDTPNRKVLPPALVAANAALNTNYDVVGFPTLIALKPDGKVAWRLEGVVDNLSTQTVIAPLQALKPL